MEKLPHGLDGETEAPALVISHIQRWSSWAWDLLLQGTEQELAARSFLKPWYEVLRVRQILILPF